MTSKIDPFFDLVFDQLHGRGLSYKAVCDQLLGKGVEVSPQALRSWHLRRSRKIAERAASLPRLPPPLQNAEPVVARVPNATKATRPTTSRPSDYQILNSDQVAGLQEIIDKQQKNLESTPFSFSNSIFPVQRKR